MSDSSDSLDRIGPYRILERLGAGGMGEVFLAHDDRLDRSVAIKRLRPEVDTDSDRRERFRREARLAARVRHSAIVQVHDILQESESDYLVMEYVEGKTLREMVRRGPLDVRQVMDLARELANGLEAAHRAGIVHRDFKTENVLVSPSGEAKITDFGIAKRLEAKEGGGETSLTAIDSVVGTCRSMSPEQARGEPVDHLTDLFAFGVLLYEALTGVSPFEAENRMTTMSRVILHRQTPVHQLNPAVPRQLSALVDRLLEKDASLRPGSAAEVRREIDEIAARLGSSEAELTSDEPTEAIEIPTLPGPLIHTPSTAPAAPAVPVAPEEPRPAPPRLFHLVLGTALALLMSLSLASFLLRSGTGNLSSLTAPAGGLLPANVKSTFAVLSFQDLSNTGESYWMSRAFPEMITRLLLIDGRLSGAARQDLVFSERDLRTAGLEGVRNYQQRLDVDYLITGVYEAREDGKLIVRFLIADRSGRRYLSEVLPGSAPALVQLSSEIASTVRQELRLPLLGAEGRNAVEAIYADLPLQAWPSYFRGMRYLHGANDERAVELLSEAARQAPRSPLPGAALALPLRSTGQRAEAARAVCQAGELSQSLPGHERLELAAMCHELSSRSAEAQGVYRTLIRENPREQAYYRQRIVMLNLRHPDRFNDALNVLQDLRRADPATLRKNDLLSANLLEAELLYQKGRHSEARRLVQETAAQAGTLHIFARADARRIEGKILVALNDFQGAIGPLQDACSWLAVLGQETRAAECHHSLVRAQFSADGTPLYDLLAESRETYLRHENLTNVAHVILTESILRQVKGELAEAARLAREAEAIFKQVGEERALALWRLEQGIQLMFLGELPDARKALDQAYADLSRQGDTASVERALRNLGEIHALRGDLQSARQAFEASPSNFSSYWRARIEAEEGRSVQAAETLESLLGQEEKRDLSLAVEIALALADFRLTSGEAEKALELAHRAERYLAVGEHRKLATLIQLQLVKIHLAQKDFAAAEDRFEAIRELAQKSMDYRVNLQSRILAARLKGLLEGGELREEALEELAHIASGCLEKENVIYAFEARLAAGELMRSPRKGEFLGEIAREARRLGLEQIARRAEKARGEG